MIKSDHKIYGTWMVSGSLFSSQLLAETDLDFGVIDLEHGHFNPSEIPLIIKLMKSKGKRVGIRTSSQRRGEILNCLDTGPDFLMVPGVSTKEEIYTINDACLFPPIGNRGSSGCTHANRFSLEDFNSFKKRANSELMIGYMVENRIAVENISSMAEVMAEDSMIYFGTYDLAESFEFSSPYCSEVVSLVEQLINEVSAIRKDLRFGMVLSGQGGDQIPKGVSFLPIFGDSGLYLRGVKEALKQYAD